MTPTRAGGTGGWPGWAWASRASPGAVRSRVGFIAGLAGCAGSPAGRSMAPRASARRAAAEPGRSGFGWSAAGAQPVRKITSKVARTRPSGRPKRAA